MRIIVNDQQNAVALVDIVPIVRDNLIRMSGREYRQHR